MQVGGEGNDVEATEHCAQGMNNVGGSDGDVVTVSTYDAIIRRKACGHIANDGVKRQRKKCHGKRAACFTPEEKVKVCYLVTCHPKAK